MSKILERNLNEEMDEIQQKIKDKIIEVTKLGLTDKAEYHAYEEVYPFLLDKFFDKKYNFLEVGIALGGGLKILSELFPESNIYGVDWNINNLQIDLNEYKNIQVFESNQCDSKFLDNLPMLDFVTEDASHQVSDSMQTFELLEPKLNSGAVYVIEDVYPQFLDHYLKDGRFKIIDVRNIKDRGDDILAVYYKE